MLHGETPKRQTAIFKLSCDHSVTYPKPWPGVGEHVLCVKCKSGSQVVEAPKRISGQVPVLSAEQAVRH